MLKFREMIKYLVGIVVILGISACDGGSGEKTYGGAKVQNAYSAQETTDGGAIVAGDTANGSAGYMDYYLLKLDSNGNVQWSRTVGGTGRENAKAVRQTNDGGYIVAGTTESYGPGNPDNHGSYGNIWIVKFDANGTQQWNKVHGNYEYDGANSIEKTLDGGYIVAGYTHSTENGSFYVIKLDAQGNKQWSRAYGNEGVPNVAKSIKPTDDGGYIVAGTTGFTQETADSLFIKINATGDVIWSQTYGQLGYYDHIEDMSVTADGGLIAGGSRTTQWPTDGNNQAWVLKLDQDGNLEWENTYGGVRDEKANSIQQTNDGGYIFAGETESYGQGVEYQPDFWIVKLDMVGNMTWSKTYGGGDQDTARSIQQIDTGYLVAGDKMVGGFDAYDIYVLKLDSNGNK